MLARRVKTGAVRLGCFERVVRSFCVLPALVLGSACAPFGLPLLSGSCSSRSSLRSLSEPSSRFDSLFQRVVFEGCVSESCVL